MSVSSTSATALAVIGVRLIGLLFLLVGGWQLVANLVDGWMEFDPTYLGYFLRAQMMRPALAAIIGLSLLFMSGRIGRRMARGLS